MIIGGQAVVGGETRTGLLCKERTCENLFPLRGIREDLASVFAGGKKIYLHRSLDWILEDRLDR